MKINKILLGLTIVVAGMMVSCNTDAEGTIYSPDGMNVSFESEAPATITTSESSITIPVRIMRYISKGAYTVNFTTEASEEGIFTTDGNGSVTFADGENVAIVNVIADNMAKGADYTYKLTLSEADAATVASTNNQNITTTIKIHSDYNWLSAGNCTFIDYTFSDGTEALNVPIQQAEGTNIYRIVEPFIAVYGDASEDGFASDTGILFTLNDDNTIDFVIGEDDIICALDGKDYLFVWPAAYVGSYCNLFSNDNLYFAEMLGLVGGEGYYTGFAFEFEWTTGWPGQQ